MTPAPTSGQCSRSTLTKTASQHCSWRPVVLPGHACIAHTCHAMPSSLAAAYGAVGLPALRPCCALQHTQQSQGRMNGVMLMSAVCAGERCWVGNAMGKLQVLDMRQRCLAGSLKGCSGAVTGLAAHGCLPLLAAVGLDRFLRVYNTSSRQLVAKVFLKQQLTGVAFCPTDPAPAPPAPQGKSKARAQDFEKPAPQKRRRQSNAVSF